MIVKLNRKERLSLIIESTALDFSKRDKWGNEKKNNWGAGLINTDRFPHHAEMVGLYGQFVVAEVLDLDCNLKVKERGDGGVDLVAPLKINEEVKNVNISVKTQTNLFKNKNTIKDISYNDNLVYLRKTNAKGKELKMNCQIHIFCVCDVPQTLEELNKMECITVDVLGFMKSKDILSKGDTRVADAIRGTHKNYYFSTNELEKIEVLKYMIEKNRIK